MAEEEKKRESACYVWDTNFPEGEWTSDEIVGILKLSCKKWCFQKEKGETGYVHYQMRVSLKEKVRTGAQVAALVGQTWHWSRTSKANFENDFYASKNDTRVEGPWRDTDPKVWPVPWQHKGIEDRWMQWQKDIIAWKEVRNDRWIEVIFDKVGQQGKSTVANVLERKGEAYCLVASKNINEMCADLCDELTAAQDYDPRMIFVDCERMSDQQHMGAVYAALERIKGGVVKDRRYRLRKWFFGSPNVVVFTNRLPELYNLSRDRWRFWQIRQEQLVMMTEAELKAARAVQYLQEKTRREAEEARQTK